MRPIIPSLLLMVVIACSNNTLDGQKSEVETIEPLGSSIAEPTPISLKINLSPMPPPTDKGTAETTPENITEEALIVRHKEPSPCDSVPETYRQRCEDSIREDAMKESETGESPVGSNYYVKNFDPNNLPKVAQSNFTELDKFSRISRLRSGVGHDYSFNTPEYDPSGSNCKSMKHYFLPMGIPRENHLYSSTPHSFKWMSIKFFAPADGMIQDVVYTRNSYGLETQFSIQASHHPGYYFNFYHVKLNPDLVFGTSVEAGQHIGTLGSEEAWGEIAVEVRVNSREAHLLSFLQVATDEVLNLYNARGVISTSDVIVTRQERDANPLACDTSSEARWFEGSGRYKANESFMIWQFESTDNWFFLN